MSEPFPLSINAVIRICGYEKSPLLVVTNGGVELFECPFEQLPKMVRDFILKNYDDIHTAYYPAFGCLVSSSGGSSVWGGENG